VTHVHACINECHKNSQNLHLETVDWPNLEQPNSGKMGQKNRESECVCVFKIILLHDV